MQLPDPGEGALGVDGAGVWKKCATIKLKTMFIAAMVVLYMLLWLYNFFKIIIRTSYIIENTSNMEK